ncbi:MAG: RNA polymerase sigma factor [Planctomycetota bacterium]
MNPPISSNPEPDAQTDAVLVAQARAGDRPSFDALILRHQDRVYNMALRMLGHREDALDVAQEIFVTIFRSLDRFEEKARFSTWLYRVTVNRCRDELRRRTTVKHTRPRSLATPAHGDPEGRPDDPPARGASPLQGAVARETEELVAGAIRELPEDAREVLVMRDVEDLSYDEIADVLEIPVGTVRSRLNRARTLLRERIRPILEVES